MRKALFLLPGLALAAACAPVGPTSTGSAGTSPGRTSAVWPEQVVQALPRGVSDDAVLRDSDGCYAFRDPASPTGFSLVIGIDGRQLCDGRFPNVAEIQALAAEMRAEIQAGNTDIADTPPPQ
jgi:hypothetical protein